MKKLSTLFSLFLITLVSVGNAAAQSVKTAPSSALMYEITGPKLKQPSYIFGTIHLICEKDMFAKEKVLSYLERSGQLMLEMNVGDPTLLQKVAAASMISDGKSVKDHMTADEYARLDNLYKEYLGISFDMLQKFKPMMSSSYLYTSPKVLGCQPPAMYDNYFAQAAASRKISVIGLETVEDQIAAIDSQPLEKQIKDLSEMSADPQKSITQFKELYKLYLTQDSDALYTFSTKQSVEKGMSMDKMLDGRNIKWIPAIEKNIAEKPTFIAVGAAHLGGKKGVVNLLREKGYKLKPIRFETGVR